MLLEDIIDLATDNQQSITVLLRKCVVLGHQIKNERLKVWANKELNSYGKDDDLPAYRVTTTQSKGNFSGWGGSQTNGFIIPPAVLEQKHRRFATEARLPQAISAYEDLVRTAKPDGTILSPWPPDLVLYYQDRIRFKHNQQWSLVAAYQEIPKSGLVELLDTVRNRVLNMALEIQSEVGKKDEDLKKMTPQIEEKIDQTIIQQIYGGNVYIATGQSSMTIQQQNIACGDWGQLEQVLRNSGLSQPELNELSSAVKQDGQKMGSTVLDWIKKTGPNVLSSGVKIGAAIGQTLLTEYLKQYCGPS